MPSTPALPLLAFTCCKACFRFSRSQISSIHRFVLAGLSGSCVVAKAGRAAGLPGTDLIKYEVSATHQEILAGSGGRRRTGDTSLDSSDARPGTRIPD